jgi:predicted O-methyltransferase YrrM
MPEENSLKADPIESVLAELHADAYRDRFRFISLLPRMLFGFLRGKNFSETMTPASLKECYIPVSREQGELLYLTTRALNAKNIVEFGTSFGISTIYLAAGAKDNGGGMVIGSEIEPSKHVQAEFNLNKAGLTAYSDIRLGDALETLREVPQPIDLVLLDGWKDLYMPVIELLKPNLRKGSVVLADNIFTFRTSLRPYVEYMQNGQNGFASTTLHIADGFEYSVYIN